MSELDVKGCFGLWNAGFRCAIRMRVCACGLGAHVQLGESFFRFAVKFCTFSRRGIGEVLSLRRDGNNERKAIARRG